MKVEVLSLFAAIQIKDKLLFNNPLQKVEFDK